MDTRRERLAQARLYLVCDAQPDRFLRSVLSAGVDVVQLRMKEATDEQIVERGTRFREICSEHDALLILNDRPDLAVQVDSDGVHLGQDDTSVTRARELVGQGRLIGLSTHSPDQIDRAHGVDYIGVGPVFQTPTKPGRPAVGLELVSYAAGAAGVPFFAIGGISTANVSAVHGAGADRVAVVRALTEARAPAVAARVLREAVALRRAQESYVGSA